MTHRICFKAWFVFFLVATIGGAMVGFVLGAVIGGALGIAGVDAGLIKIICGAAGFLLAGRLGFGALSSSSNTLLKNTC